MTRIALAVVFQLTNTFTRQSTGIDDFFEFNVRGADSLPASDTYGTQRFVDAFAEAAHAQNIVVASSLNLVARANGSVRADTIATLSDKLVNALDRSKGTFDAVVLVLSGAMTSADFASADLPLIEAARAAVGANTPILAAFSHWANLSEEIVRSVDLAIGVDFTDNTAAERKATVMAECALSLVERAIHPVTEMRKLRILTPMGPNRAAEAVASAREMAVEFIGQPAVVDVSIFEGFPFADVSHAGMSVTVTTDGDRVLAAGFSERLQRSIWDQREAFGWSPPNVEVAIHDAMLIGSDKVVIADVSDDPMFGATGDGTGLLWALIDLGAPDAALGLVVDPAGVAAAIESGVGTEIKIDIGGSFDRRAGYPVNVTARIRRIASGPLITADQSTFDTGRAVVLDVQGRHGGQIDVILSERAPAEINEKLFEALGVQLAKKKIVGVKRTSRLGESFPTAGEILVTSTPGISTPLFHYFNWERIPRPMHPLDAV